MSITKIFIGKENSDSMEGRGPMRVVGYYPTEEKAYEAIKGRGVMGVGDGEVYVAEMINDGVTALYTEERIYGYRKRPDGRWDNGWYDFRDIPDPAVDPEYAEYLRLRKKFA